MFFADIFYFSRSMFHYVGCSIWHLCVPSKEEQRRVGWLMIALSFVHGATIGPLIDQAMETNPSLLVSAFAVAALFLACLLAAVILAKWRGYLDGLSIAGFISSIPLLLWLQFASSALVVCSLRYILGC